MPATPSLRQLALGALALLLALALPACGSDTPAEMDRDTFVEVMVALREAEMAVEHEDSAAVLYEIRRDEIFAEYRVTQEEILGFTRAQQNLDALEETWDTIAERLRHPFEPDVPDEPERTNFRQQPVQERSPRVPDR